MLGQVLKSIRTAQDKKVKEVADDLGSTSSLVCDIENGRKNVTINMLSRFSQIYQVPASKILEWDEKAKRDNLSYPEILLFCVQYECKKLKNQEINIDL